MKGGECWDVVELRRVHSGHVQTGRLTYRHSQMHPDTPRLYVSTDTLGRRNLVARLPQPVARYVVLPLPRWVIRGEPQERQWLA